MKTFQVFMVVVLLKETASQILTFNNDGQSLILNCETTDFAAVINFYQGTGNRGGCVNGLCLTTISGYENPTQNGKKTSMKITTCDSNRDFGTWTCRYGTLTSPPVPISTCILSGTKEEFKDFVTILINMCVNLLIFLISSLTIKKLLPPKLQAFDLFMYINHTEDDVHWRGIYIILCGIKSESGMIFLEEDERFILKHDSILTFKVKDIDLESIQQIKIGYRGDGTGKLCHLIKVDIFKKGVSKHFMFNLECWITKETVTVQPEGTNQPPTVKKNIEKEDVPDEYSKVKRMIVKVMVVEMAALATALFLILYIMYKYHGNYSLEVVLPVCIVVLTVIPYVVQVIITYQIYKRMYKKKCYFVNHEDIDDKKTSNAIKMSDIKTQ